MRNVYLAHFGKKGSHWGVRTTQPYGTGYIRKNGKRGIEMLGVKSLDLQFDPNMVGGGGGGGELPEELQKIGSDSSLMSPDIIDPNEDSSFNLLDPNDLRRSEDEHKRSNKSELFSVLRKTIKDDLEVNKLELLKDSIRIGEAALANVKSYLNDRRISQLESDPENSELKLKTRHWTEEEDMKAVNPGFKNFDKNTKYNCMLCTTTYDLRRRGYDVTAERASSGYYTNELRRWYPDATTKVAYHATSSEQMRARNNENYACTRKTVKSLLEQPDGARGNLTVTWGAGGGHSVVYEIKKRQVIIRDCQTNKTYKGKKLEKLLNSCSSAEYTRLDNVRVDKKAVSEVIKG